MVPTLRVDERVANEVNEVVGGVPGMADLAVYRSMGQPNLVITPDRAAVLALWVERRRCEQRGSGRDRRSGGYPGAAGRAGLQPDGPLAAEIPPEP